MSSVTGISNNERVIFEILHVGIEGHARKLSYRCFIGAHYTILTPKCTLEGTNLLSDQAILAKLSRASTMDSIASSASPLPMPARTYSQKAQSPVRL